MTIRCSQFIADSRQLVHFIFHGRSIVPQYRQYEIIQGLPVILNWLGCGLQLIRGIPEELRRE